MTALIPYAPHWITEDIRQDEWTRHYALWLSEFKSRNTREAYHRAWCDFMRFTQGRDGSNPPLHFGVIEPQHIRLWKITLQDRYEATTINQKLSAVSSFYKYILGNAAYLRDDNPAANVRQLPVNPYGKATMLHDDQDIELLQSIDTSTPGGLRDHTILLLYLTTAVRLRELATATLDNFRRQGAVTIFVYTGKGGGTYKKRLPSHVARALWAYVAAAQPLPGVPVFSLAAHQVQYMVRRRCDMLFGEGHGITVHSLRHTAAQNAARYGTVLDVRALLEHKSTRVTAIYLDHVTGEQGDKMSDEIAGRYAQDEER